MWGALLGWNRPHSVSVRHNSPTGPGWRMPGSLCIISHNSMWIYSKLNIKGLVKKTTDSRCGENLHPMLWEYKRMSHFWNSLVSPQNANCRATMWPRDTPPHYPLKRNGNICPHNIHAWNVPAALFTAGKEWKKPRCPLTADWVNRRWSVRRGYCSAVTRNGALAHTQCDCTLEHMTRQSQTQKATHCMIPFLWHVWEGKSMETEHRRMSVQIWRGGGRDWPLVGTGFFRGDENVLKLDCCDGYTIPNMGKVFSCLRLLVICSLHT